VPAGATRAGDAGWASEARFVASRGGHRPVTFVKSAGFPPLTCGFVCFVDARLLF
jgi:hypothetical protein